MGNSLDYKEQRLEPAWKTGMLYGSSNECATGDKSKKPGELRLIDAMSLVFRAFYAPIQASLVSSSGMPTKAVYIFVRTLLKLLKERKPDYAAAAFDLAAPTFRDKLFEEYKANRPAFPDDLVAQVPFVRRFCQALGVPVVEMEGFEADDIIGTLARQASEQGLEVSVSSGDEDLFQLVGDHIRVLKPGRGGEKETVCDAQKVKEILGVEPHQVVDWLALTGDPSDNIPGARPLPGREESPGVGEKKRSHIGPKGATELIRQFGTLENVLANYEQVKRQSYRDALRDYRNEALLSRELARIRTDVPLRVTLQDLRLGAWNLDELRALCQELSFTSLLEELLATVPPSSAPMLPVRELARRSDGEQSLEGLDRGVSLAIAFGTSGGEGFDGQLTEMAFTDGKTAARLDLNLSPHVPESVAQFLADASIPKATHNSKLLRLLLRKHGVRLEGVTQDTMLYSSLLDPLASSHALADVSLRRMGQTLHGSVVEAALRTGQLAGLLAPQISREGLQKLYEEIELPLTSVLADVEEAGVKIDPAILAEMSKEFDKELATLTGEIYALAGGPFDIDSPKQLGEVLFGKLGLPGGKKLKKSGQYSTAAGVLEALAEQHELPHKILEYRTRAKLKSTYIDALPKYLIPTTGRLHSSFNQAGARTGRISSSNPNLQNVPVGDEFGLRIRAAFVAEEGWTLIAADYSQIELRVLAHLSEDPRLIEAFAHREDIHARTAQEIFGVPPALQTHEHRRMAKAINYGVIYGLSSFGLAGRTGSTKTEAQEYIDAYFARYRKVKEFLDRTLEEARQTGRVRTLFGRLRPIPEINSRDVQSRNRAEREAMNTPVQGTAADLLKIAMVKTHARLRREKMKTRMILTVHDELVFEAPDGEVEAARRLVKEEMEGVYPMRAPLRVDLGVGENWREAK